MQKNRRYESILSKDIDEQRILQSDWAKGKSGSLRCCLLLMKKTMISRFFPESYNWIGRDTTGHTLSKGSRRCNFCLMTVSIH